MKPGKLTGTIATGLVGGGLTTAAATQVTAIGGALTLGNVANATAVTAVSGKVAATGFTLLGPIAAGANAIFGTSGALASFFGVFGAGIITSFIVPAIAIGMAAVALKCIYGLATKGGEMVDTMVEASQQRKQAAQKAAEETKTQTPEQGAAPAKDTSLAPTVSKEEAWHPANEAEKRGVSYRDNLDKSRKPQPSLSRA
jgi:hypothetical protein